MPELTVSIVTYNSAETILGCLKSVYASSLAVELEVLLFDNASTDATVQKIRENFPQVQLYQSETNLGFGRANNFLLEKSSGKYILFLNPDTVLPIDTLQKLLELVRSRFQAGAVGPRLAFADGAYQISTSAYPSLRNELISKFYHRALDRNIKSVRKHLENQYPRTSAVTWVGGACLLCSRDKLIKVGGFDPGFFLYFEDIDLCKRLCEQGWKNFYVPEAVAIHLGGASVSSIHWIKELEFRKSELYYYSKHLSVFSYYMLKLYLWVKFGLRWLGWKLMTTLNLIL